MMNALQIARCDILSEMRDTIRKHSVIHVKITLQVAIDNFFFLFEQGRYQDARHYWFQVVEPLRKRGLAQ